MTETPPKRAANRNDQLSARRDYGRPGRNLPAAIGVGAALGAAIVLSLLFFNWGFVALVAAALCLGAWELYSALRKNGITAAIVPIIGGTCAIVIGSYAASINPQEQVPTGTVLLAAMALTVLASFLWRIPKGLSGYLRDVAGSMLIIVWVPMLGSFTAMLLAGEHGAARIVTFLLVVVLSDVGGYFFGVLWGRHPMAPKVSPKKSWEGVVGSALFGIAGGVGMAIFGLHVRWWVGVVIGIALVAVGTCGDLVESMIKRDLGIKDMSSFLPGHGGVMDRLDSLLFAAPVAWLLMYLLVPGG